MNEVTGIRKTNRWLQARPNIVYSTGQRREGYPGSSSPESMAAARPMMMAEWNTTSFPQLEQNGRKKCIERWHPSQLFSAVKCPSTKTSICYLYWPRWSRLPKTLICTKQPSVSLCARACVCTCLFDWICVIFFSLLGPGSGKRVERLQFITKQAKFSKQSYTIQQYWPL